MWIEIFPSIIMLTIAGWYAKIHRQQTFLLIYALITTSYLNLFPMLNYLLSGGLDMESFNYFQWLVVFFFQIPLLTVAHFVAGKPIKKLSQERVQAALSPWLPWILIILLVAFWYCAIRYNIFFRRIGHEALQANTAEIPYILLYVYRLAIETSFFIMMFLWITLNFVSYKNQYFNRYKWTLVAYLISFMPYYLLNSRMHTILFFLCAFCIHPKFTILNQKPNRLLPLSVSIAALIIALTILRELVLEDNNRINIDDYFNALHSLLLLIAERLDSLMILHRLDHVGFNILRFDLTGIDHSISFVLSFFIDQQNYMFIKNSLVTSPSVVIVNRLLVSTEVDFPKSMALDMFLSFGLFGFLMTGVLLGVSIGRVQKCIIGFRGFNISYCVSLYALPMLLQFEKEFTGFLILFIKWFPLLFIIYWQRPRFN